MNDNHKLTPELTEAVDALAENLLAAEPFLALERAYLRLQEDAQGARPAAAVQASRSDPARTPGQPHDGAGGYGPLSRLLHGRSAGQ